MPAFAPTQHNACFGFLPVATRRGLYPSTCLRTRRPGVPAWDVLEGDAERHSAGGSAHGFRKWSGAVGFRRKVYRIIGHQFRRPTCLRGVVNGLRLREPNEPSSVVVEAGVANDWFNRGCVAHLRRVLWLDRNGRPTGGVAAAGATSVDLGVRVIAGAAANSGCLARAPHGVAQHRTPLSSITESPSAEDSQDVFPPPGDADDELSSPPSWRVCVYHLFDLAGKVGDESVGKLAARHDHDQGRPSRDASPSSPRPLWADTTFHMGPSRTHMLTPSNCSTLQL